MHQQLAVAKTMELERQRQKQQLQAAIKTARQKGLEAESANGSFQPVSNIVAAAPAAVPCAARQAAAAAAAVSGSRGPRDQLLATLHLRCPTR